MMLVDAGDGVSGQLAKAGVSLGTIRAVFISHLHFDHTGGLFGFLGLRRVTSPGPLTVYGPPGTQRTVESLIAAMEPVGALGRATQTSRGEGAPIEVIELKDGSVVNLGEARVTVATNTHYTIDPTSSGDGQFLSLSFRFELPDRTIVYTGDTGPSEAVERLATGADLLVAEISDPNGLISAAQKAGRVFPPATLKVFDHHMRHEHLTPEELGFLAARSGVKELVVTHIGLGNRTDEQTLPRVAANYPGPITFANDLDKF